MLLQNQRLRNLNGAFDIVTLPDNARIGNGAGIVICSPERKETSMDGEQNGTQAQQQDTQQESNQQQTAQQPQQETQQGQPQAAPSGVDAEALEKQLAERDSRIQELEGQIAEAAKNAEAAEGLREEIAALKRQGADERIEFKLLLAGCRNVKAAKAVLEDHGGDVEKLKEAEPWMFADSPQKQTGKTGLPNAGAAADEGKEVKRWRELAGLDEKKEG